MVAKDGAVGKARAVSDHPLVQLERKYDYDPNDKYDDELRYIQYCVRFDIEKAGAGYGIAANGYGITPSSRDRGAIYSNNTQRPSLAVEAGVSYDLGLYLQGEKYKGKVSIWLEDIDGQVSVRLDTDATYQAEVAFMTAHDTNIKNQGDQNYYSSHPDVPADFSYAEAITPQTKALGTVKSSFTFTMPENAVGVVRLLKQ